MLDISKVVLPSGQEYTFEDSVARAAIANTSTNKITFYATSVPTQTIYIIAKEVE